MIDFRKLVESQIQEEQIDELSKQTLGSYVKKAEADAKAHYDSSRRAREAEKFMSPRRAETRRLGLQAVRDSLHAQKRDRGIEKAKNRLSQEDHHAGYGDAGSYDRVGKKHEAAAAKASSDSERYMHLHHAAINYGHRDHEIAENIPDSHPEHKYSHMKNAAVWYQKASEHLKRSVEAQMHEHSKKFLDSAHNL